MQPTYPILAKQARVQGAVELRAIISKTGTIENLTVVSGHPMLAASAVQASANGAIAPTSSTASPSKWKQKSPSTSFCRIDKTDRSEKQHGQPKRGSGSIRPGPRRIHEQVSLVDLRRPWWLTLSQQQLTGSLDAVAIIGSVNAPRTDRSNLPEIRSLILDGRTWAEVSLTALGDNFHTVQKHVGPDVTICAVVKADGYGHGAVECARALECEGAKWLGVTDAAEGLALRDAGVEARILLMTGIWKGEENAIVAQNLTPTIWEPWHIESLERAARQTQSVLPVHLKLDTGMNRLGAPPAALPRLCQMLAQCKNLTLEGVSTHFASAEVLDAEDAVRQMKRFDEGLAVLHSYGLHPPLIHMGNSAAMRRVPILEDDGASRNRTLRIFARVHARRPGCAYSSAGAAPRALVEDARPHRERRRRRRSCRLYGHLRHADAKPHRRAARRLCGWLSAPALQSRPRNRPRRIRTGRSAASPWTCTIVDVTQIPGIAVGDEVILIGSSATETTNKTR